MPTAEPATPDEIREDLLILALRHLQEAEDTRCPERFARGLRNFFAIAEAGW